MNTMNKLFKIAAIGSFAFLFYALLSTVFHDGPKKIYGSQRGEQYWECRDVLHIFHDHEYYHNTDSEYGAISNLNNDVFVAAIWSGPIFIISTLLFIVSRRRLKFKQK